MKDPILFDFCEPCRLPVSELRALDEALQDWASRFPKISTSLRYWHSQLLHMWAEEAGHSNYSDLYYQRYQSLQRRYKVEYSNTLPKL